MLNSLVVLTCTAQPNGRNGICSRCLPAMLLIYTHTTVSRVQMLTRNLVRHTESQKAIHSVPVYLSNTAHHRRLPPEETKSISRIACKSIQGTQQAYNGLMSAIGIDVGIVGHFVFPTLRASHMAYNKCEYWYIWKSSVQNVIRQQIMFSTCLILNLSSKTISKYK
jgi:hypothetical protein